MDLIPWPLKQAERFRYQFREADRLLGTIGAHKGIEVFKIVAIVKKVARSMADFRTTIGGLEPDFKVPVERLTEQIGPSIAWHLMGRQNFFLSDTLCEALESTDLSKIPGSCLVSPYSSLFFQFETPRIILDPPFDRPCIGAFIWSWDWDGSRDGRHPTAQRMDLDIRNADAHVITFQLLFTGALTCFEGIIRVPRDSTPMSKTTTFHGRTPTHEGIIRRLICGLFLYLSCPHPDIQQVKPPAAKPGASKGARRFLAKKREQLRSTVKIGFNTTYIQKADPRNSGGNETGRHVRLHLVRGHWKNQPCGPRNSERRIVWIRPYWAGRAKGYVERITYVADVDRNSNRAVKEGEAR